MILPRPPKDWKRPAIPTLVKLDVVIRQEGRCKQTGDKLGTLKNTQFDHRPALWERKFDTVSNDTIPPANDPSLIEACTVAGHKVRTHGTGSTSVGSDSHRRAKIKRFTEPKTDKPKRKIPRRPFPTGRKLSSRASS
jgi:hypothetical protein